MSSGFRRKYGTKKDASLERDEVPVSLRSGLISLVKRLDALDVLDRSAFRYAYKEACRKLRQVPTNSFLSEEILTEFARLIEHSKWDEMYELCELLAGGTQLFGLARALDWGHLPAQEIVNEFSELLEKWKASGQEKDPGYRKVERALDKWRVLSEELNDLLEEEGAMWRMRHGEIVPVLPDEVDAVIDDAYSAAGALSGGGTRIHLQKARRFLGLRPDPELENAVKEAVCAMEAAVKDRSGINHFEKGLKRLKQQKRLADPWSQTVDNLFGKASRAYQVRHGHTIPSSMGFEEARDLVSLAAVLVQHLSSIKPAQPNGTLA